MVTSESLNGLDVSAAVLQPEWMITIDTPDAGVANVLMALQQHIALVQGPYDCCSFVRGSGQQRFRCREGSYEGAEESVQQTSASQIVVSIPRDEDLLKQLFKIVFESHVNEEPTIRVQEVWGSRSKLTGDRDNPNRYWNRVDRDTLHGTPTGKQQ